MIDFFSSMMHRASTASAVLTTASVSVVSALTLSDWAVIASVLITCVSAVLNYKRHRRENQAHAALLTQTNLQNEKLVLENKKLTRDLMRSDATLRMRKL